MIGKHSGYREIQNPPKRYGIIDLRELSSLCRLREVAEFQQAHRRWVDDSLTRERVARDARWSEAIAVGNLSFVEKLKSELGFKAAHPATTRRFNSSHRLKPAARSWALSSVTFRC
jgi:putative transposase